MTSSRLIGFLASFLFVIGLCIGIYIFSDPNYVGIVIIILVILGYFVIKPQVFLLFLILVRPSAEAFSEYGLEGFDISFKILNVNALIVALVLMTSLIVISRRLLMTNERGYHLVEDPVARAWGLFLVYFLIVSLISSPDITGSLFDLSRLASLMCVYCLGVLYGPRSQKGIFILLFCIVLSSIPPIIVSYLELAKGGVILSEAEIIRVKGFFANPVTLSHFLASIGIVLIVLMKLLKLPMVKVFFIIYFCSVLAILALTYGKGGWIALGFGLFAMALFERGYFAKIRLLIVLAVIGIGFIGFLPNIISWVAGVFDVYNVEKSTLAGRLLVWQRNMIYFRENPVWGHGLMAGFASSARIVGFEVVPHNDYLRLLIEGGIVGLAIYFFLVISLLKALFNAVDLFRRMQYEHAEMLAKCTIILELSFLCMASFDNMLTAMWLQYPIWILAGSVRGICTRESYFYQHLPAFLG